MRVWIVNLHIKVDNTLCNAWNTRACLRVRILEHVVLSDYDYYYLHSLVDLVSWLAPMSVPISRGRDRQPSDCKRESEDGVRYREERWWKSIRQSFLFFIMFTDFCFMIWDLCKLIFVCNDFVWYTRVLLLLFVRCWLHKHTVVFARLMSFYVSSICKVETTARPVGRSHTQHGNHGRPDGQTNERTNTLCRLRYK